MTTALRGRIVHVLSIALILFVLAEVNYPQLGPQSQLALFAFFGLLLCFLLFPTTIKGAVGISIDVISCSLAVFVCLYIVLQTEPIFSSFWTSGTALGDRAGAESSLDFFVGVLGVLIVIEATRRCLGWALPILSITFLIYSYGGAYAPSWLFPHRGYSVERIVAQTFLHSQGVFGIALKVMFTYVFLFVILGALLHATGATSFIVNLAKRIFYKTPGGAAKVAVLSSGLMGSLSGSAVADTATTGTFTIPMMRSIGFKPHIAAGVNAASGSGGALVPPVMGAGAYMMLELVTPPVTYLQIIRAAVIPAFIYYLALLLIVHFYSQRIGANPQNEQETAVQTVPYQGIVFFLTLGSLIAFLLLGYTVFRAVTLAIVVVLALSMLNGKTRLTWQSLNQALVQTAKGGTPLVVAAATVGIILGVVTLTGIGTKFPSTILLLAGDNLLFALLLIMLGSIILGMGLPSAVCYLLMATLIGPIISGLGIVPLAGHFFIFYFGIMSMVTPPVALAAYAAASIAGCNIMQSALAAFRFASVGFTLPFMFVFRPELLFLSIDGSDVGWFKPALATAIVVIGIIPLAAGIAGYFAGPMSLSTRVLFLIAAGLLFYPEGTFNIGNGAGLLLFLTVAFKQYQSVQKRNTGSGTS